MAQHLRYNSSTLGSWVMADVSDVSDVSSIHQPLWGSRIWMFLRKGPWISMDIGFKNTKFFTPAPWFAHGIWLRILVIYNAIWWYMMTICCWALFEAILRNMFFILTSVWVYPLAIQHSHGRSPVLMEKSTSSMAMFNSYVELPDGISCDCQGA